MTNAHDDADRREQEHARTSDTEHSHEAPPRSRADDAAAGNSDRAEATSSNAACEPVGVGGDGYVSADDQADESSIAVEVIHNSEPQGEPPSSRTPQVARVVASIALLAATAAGIGVAAGWGETSQPLSIAPPSATESTASALATSTAAAPTRPSSDAPATTDAATPTPLATTDFDTTTPSSLTVLVNKRIPLDPLDFEPDDLVEMTDIGVPSINEHALRADAAYAVKDLFAAAAEAGHTLDMTSGYRDYSLQTQLYDGYVEEQGQESADSTSARPGYSEHQTGLAADISAPDSDPFCILVECFGETEAGKWLEENAWRYGFIVRYPEGKAAITGYAYEPWHFRFIGVDAAAEYHESGAATYEEFLGADLAPGYA